jgi:mannose/fructose/N-acetylgalactosamine-specific phosphotransferase system component IID
VQVTSKAISRETDDAAAKFGKLLPSEVTALYLSLRPFIDSNKPLLLLGTAVACLVLAVLFIRIARGVTSWGHIAVYAITFAIWVLTLDATSIEALVNSTMDATPDANSSYQTISAIVSILWTFVITNLISKWLPGTVASS